jgi:hypothetical protein
LALRRSVACPDASGLFLLEITMNQINKALFPVLTKFNDGAAGVYEAFGREGISTWGAAQPTVLAWAATRYNVRVVTGQRGSTLKGADFEAAKSAVRRIRECFESTGVKKSSKASDPALVEIKRLEKLTAAQRRRVFAHFGR